MFPEILLHITGPVLKYSFIDAIRKDYYNNLEIIKLLVITACYL